LFFVDRRTFRAHQYIMYIRFIINYYYYLVIRSIALYRWSCRISSDISVLLCRPRCPVRPSATGLRRPLPCPSTAMARHGPWAPCAAPVLSTRRWRTSCNICRPSSKPFATCPWDRRPVWSRSLRPPAVYIIHNILLHQIIGNIIIYLESRYKPI